MKFRPPSADGPITATGPDGLHWTKWAAESEAEFRARVLADAARLGVVVFFEREGFFRGGDKYSER